MDLARRLHRALPIAAASLLSVATAAALPEVGTAAKKRADLALGSVSKPPASGAPGSSFRATDITKNRGRAAARASKTRFYLSLNSKKDAADLPLGQRRVKRLRKGKASKGTLTLHVPSAAATGAYLLLACADYANKLRESNERNNCRAASARMQVGAAAAGGGGGGGGGGTGGAGGASASGDRDGDGVPNESDCEPDDATIKPGAPDEPDLAFTDSNCDGIDGDQAGAVFVSPTGSNSNPGTRSQPKLTVQAGIDAAATGTPKDVYVAAGNYSGGAALADDVGVYGGYDPATWARSLGSISAISGAPQAALADGDTGVVLQLLTLHGTALAPTDTPYDPSVYGLRAVQGSAPTLQRVAVHAAAGAKGANGTAGATPAAAENGTNGSPGSSGFSAGGAGGPGGTSASGAMGGAGGRGGYGTDSPPSGSPGSGSPGSPGSPPGSAGSGQGGPGGDASPVCFTDAETGGTGTDGDNGAAGAHGSGGLFSNALAGQRWTAAGGAAGANGTVGRGGGGGGGGGGYGGTCADDRGGGGGGGGAGGQPGAGGGAGGYGGGSFAVYLHDSTLMVGSSDITAANGGAGGDGAAGGTGVAGGAGGGGGGGPDDGGDGGPGGKGGNGGIGGAGGGGAGGPSYGVFKGGSSTATVGSTTISVGSGGPGGAAGTGSTNNGAAGASAATAP